MQESFEKQKQQAAKLAASCITPELIIGLGSGSTAEFFIQELSKLPYANSLTCVASSQASYNLAQKLGLRLIPLESCSYVDIAIDGADAVDIDRNLLKGFGAALTREKIVASMAKEFWILIDERKQRLKLPLERIPCEILPSAYSYIISKLHQKEMTASLRKKSASEDPFISDNEAWIIDIDASGSSLGLKELDLLLHLLPGVIETGLFLGFNIRLFDGSLKNQYLA